MSPFLLYQLFTLFFYFLLLKLIIFSTLFPLLKKSHSLFSPFILPPSPCCFSYFPFLLFFVLYFVAYCFPFPPPFSLVIFLVPLFFHSFFTSSSCFLFNLFLPSFFTYSSVLSSSSVFFPSFPNSHDRRKGDRRKKGGGKGER